MTSMHAVEAVFIVLLVLTALTIAWFAGLVVVKLYKGQR